MSRISNILLTQFRQLSITEFIKLIFMNVYKSDPLIIYSYNLRNISNDAPSELIGYDISKGTITDLEDAKRSVNPLPWEFQCNFFDNITDFFIAKNSNGIQHISWIYYAEDHNRILKLGTSDAEIKFCLTLPEARGKGLYPKVINAILGYLRDKGMTHVFMCVHKDNTSSIRGIEKAGFERVAALTLRKVLGLQVSKRFVTSEV
jgi:ribosomal protein S18 acetylase RimI-like enzyme